MILFLLSTLSTLLLLSSSAPSPYPTKKLAGPPSEFSTMRTPDPSTVITELTSSSQNIWFKPQSYGEGKTVYITSIPIDTLGNFVFSLASPFYENLQLSMIDPMGNPIDLESVKQMGFVPLGDEIEVPVVTYIVPEALQGEYTLTIDSDLPKDLLNKLSTSGYPNAVISVLNNDDVKIHTHMTTYEIKKGKKVGIISTVVNPNVDVSNFHVTEAELEIITPQGVDETIPMTDTDSVLSKFNYVPQTGVYGAEFEATETGTYLVQASLKGSWNSLSSVIPFERTSQHIIEVSEATVELASTPANLRTGDSGRYLIDIPVTGTGDQIRAYAEVYGVDAETKETIPVCWLGGIVTIENNAVTLELDPNWLKLAGVNGPLTLENVYISDLLTSFPVTSISGPINVDGSENLHVDFSDAPVTITTEMRVGVNPLPKPQNNSADDAAVTLLTLPGYCATGNPWEATSSSFTNAAFFSMARGNYGHHAFATKVIDYLHTVNPNPKPLSLIGHSQGGCVSAHIYNYFFSGIDYSGPGRKIQSVGTPYVGCTAAGSLANLGEVFGVGCGSNTDLSIDGATNWMTGITVPVRNAVYYYTTTYEQNKLFGDWCNLAMNIVLQWPNDGTCELKYSGMPTGTNLGNKEKQCHTTNMAYQAQYLDASRNKVMNDAAAR